MRRIEVFALSLSLFVSTADIVLLALGESRPDVYIALTILVYYVLYAIVDPFVGRTPRYVYALNAALFTLFIAIVAYRVLEIIAGI